MEAEFAGQRVVIAGADGGIEVDKMQPWVRLKFFEEAEHIGNGEFAFAAVD